MKVKLLLFALFMFLPFCAKAQEQEKTFKVYFSDLPDGMQVSDLGVNMLIKHEYGETNWYMEYNYDDNCFFTSSNYYYELNNASSVRLIFSSRGMISNDTIDWQLDSQQNDYSKTISLKDYRKVNFDIEKGWNFYTKISEGEYVLSEFLVGYSMKNGENVFSPVAGSIGTIVTSPQEQDFYIYAKPGNYVWQGDITRISDNMTMNVPKKEFTVAQGNDNASLSLDLENNTIAIFNVTGFENAENTDFELALVLPNEDESFYYINLQGKNGTSSVLLPNSQTYEWICNLPDMKPYYYPNRGQITTTGSTLVTDIDFSSYVKLTLNLKGLESFDRYTANINLKSYYTSVDNESQVVLYMPSGTAVEGAVELDALDNETVYRALPYYLNLKVDNDEEIDIDYSQYHRVDFKCEESYVESNIINEKGDYVVYGSHTLLTDGIYSAIGYYEEGLKLTKDFTVSGKDITVIYDYNPNDYAVLTGEIKNQSVIPDNLDIYSFRVDMYDENGDNLDGLYFYMGSVSTVSKKLKKGKYTYQAILETDGPYSINIPFTGTIDLTSDASISFDLSELCFVPVEISNDTQTPIDFIYYTVDKSLDFMSYLEIDNVYMIAKPGTYNMSFYSPKHETIEKSIVIDKQTDKIELNFKAADVYPLMIYVENSDVTVNISVEGVGAYQINDEEFEGNLLPFLTVKAGTYKLTITAEGYKTITQMIEVSEDTYSVYDEGVVYEFVMEKEGSSVENVQDAAEPVVSVLHGRISVEAKQDADIRIYGVSGYGVASAQGTSLLTETLNSGVYIVKVVSAQGSFTKKVFVGK